MIKDGNITLRTFPQVENQRERLKAMLAALPKGDQEKAHAAIDNLIETAMFAGYSQGAEDAATPEGKKVLAELSRITSGSADTKRLN